MDQLQIVQECDHRVISRKILVDTFNYVKTASTSQSLVKANVMAIYEVTYNNITLNPELYSLYSDYIIWVSNTLAPPEGATFSVTIKYMDANMNIYADYNCPRCNGTGWYINPIKEGSTISKVSSSMTVAQDFIKCLLTVRGTNRIDESFGAGLLLDGGIQYFDNTLEGVIRSAIKTAEQQCISIQRARNSVGSELLDSAELTSIDPDPRSGTVYLTIRLISAAGATLTFGFNI